MEKIEDKKHDIQYSLHFKKNTNMRHKYCLQAFQIRDEDFNSIFKELPLDEKLIVGMYY